MQVAVTKNLIMLARGAEELLLANAVDLKTLYIQRGRDYVKQFLDVANRLGTVAAIQEAFPQDVQLLDMLLAHGIMVEAGAEEGSSPGDVLAEIAKRDRLKGMSVFLLLSQSCNLGCIYCLNGKMSYQTGKHLKMQPEVALQSVERSLKTLEPDGRLEVVFFGGEPLLNWPLAKEVILYGEKLRQERFPDKQIRYFLTSNLTFLPADFIDWAQKYQIGILCDVDGPPEIHNRCRPYKDGRPSHGVIVNNIRKLTEAGLAVGLRATITALNQDYLPDIARHHQEIGGAGCAFVPVCPINSDEELLPDELVPSPDRVIQGVAQVYHSKVWDTPDLFPFSTLATSLTPGERTVVACGAPYGTAAVVDVQGDVYPCIYLVGVKRFYVGNILHQDYPDQRLLDGLMASFHVDHLEDCRECVWRYYCGGGCPIRRMTIFTNPQATPKIINYCKQMYCDYTQKILELLLWERAEKTALALEEGEIQQQDKEPVTPAFC